MNSAKFHASILPNLHQDSLPKLESKYILDDEIDLEHSITEYETVLYSIPTQHRSTTEHHPRQNHHKIKYQELCYD